MADKKQPFNISSMLNVASLNEVTQPKRKIDYRQLIPHKKNHYSMNNIEELADAIENVGLLQDVVVKPAGNDQYTIIAGHRRHMAIKLIVEERGNTSFAEIPCFVLPEGEHEAMTQLKLHLTNLTAREMTEHDKMQAIAELKDLIQQARDAGYSIKGKTREIIADTVDLGETQVQKYLNIHEKATDEVKEALREGEITVQEAYDTTRPKKAPKKKAAPEAPTGDFEGDTDREGEVAAPDTESGQNEPPEAPTGDFEGDTDREGEVAAPDTESGQNEPPEPSTATVKAAITKYNAFKKAAAELDNRLLDTLIGKLDKQLNKIKKEAGIE